MLGATIVIMLGVLLSRLLAIVREAVIAHQFGGGRSTDLYNAAFDVPDIIFYLIAGGALSSAFIPVFTEHIERGEEREAWRLFSVIATATVAIVGGLILLGEIFAVQLVLLTKPGFLKNPVFGMSAVLETAQMTRILLPAQVTFFLGGLMMGALQVKGNNLGQIVGPSVYNLGIILGGLLLKDQFALAGLCYGALIGAILGNVILQWVLVRRVGGLFTTSIFRNFHHPSAGKVWSALWPILLGLSLPQVCPLINRWFASSLAAGAITGINNANRLMNVPLGIFGQACGIAIFPMMSQHAARGDMPALRRAISFGVRFILFLTAPSSVFMFVASRPIVQLVLQSGKFTVENTNLTAAILQAYTIGIFAWSAQAVIARGFYSLKDTRTPVIIGTVVTLLFAAGNAITLRWIGREDSLRAACALATVTSAAAILNVSVLLVMLRSRIGGIDGARLLVSTVKIVIASAALGAACCGMQYWLVFHPLPGSLKLAAAGTVALVGGAGTAAYLLAAIVLRMDETKTLVALVQRRARRRSS